MEVVEDAIIKLSTNGTLSSTERIVAKKYFKNEELPSDAETVSLGSQSKAAPRKRKKVDLREAAIMAKVNNKLEVNLKKAEFVDVAYCPCTSLDAERSFSVAKYLSDHRIGVLTAHGRNG